MGKPANYRLADDPEHSCEACTHYDGGHCNLYDADVAPDMVSDGFTQAGGETGAQYSMSELFFADGDVEDRDGEFVWKTVLRTGEWKLSPENGKPVKKPMKVVADGKSDTRRNKISMQELQRAFDDGAIEHVTIPLSHADKVDENTGYIRKLKIEDDPNRPGEKLMKAAFHFTEPEVGEKVKRGSIANTSLGILYDYMRKSDAKKFPVALAHAALTNRPWVDGMAPFGVAASDEIDVDSVQSLVLDEDDENDGGDPEDPQGQQPDDVDPGDQNVKQGVEVETHAPGDEGVDSSVETEAEGLDSSQREREERFAELTLDTSDIVEGGEQMSEKKGETLELAELQAQLAEERKLRERDQEKLGSLEEEVKARRVDDRITELKKLGLAEHTGLLKTVRSIMLCDDGGPALLLSEEQEDGETEVSKLTATGVVDLLIDSLPKKDGKIALSEQVLVEDADDKPEETANKELSQTERVEAAEAFLYPLAAKQNGASS
jgi:hypothetical protein